MRGQVSVELFLVLSLFIVMFLWMANLASAYRGNAIHASVATAQSEVGVSMARLIATACAANASISYSVPCIDANNLAVNITAAGLSLNVSSALASQSFELPCPASGSVLASCSSEAVCLTPGAEVNLLSGACE